MAIKKGNENFFASVDGLSFENFIKGSQFFIASL